MSMDSGRNIVCLATWLWRALHLARDLYLLETDLYGSVEALRHRLACGLFQLQGARIGRSPEDII